MESCGSCGSPECSRNDTQHDAAPATAAEIRHHRGIMQRVKRSGRPDQAHSTLFKRPLSPAALSVEKLVHFDAA